MDRITSGIPEKPLMENKACDRCRQRHIRCSMHLPLCKQCTVTHNPCNYTKVLQRKRTTNSRKFDEANPIQLNLELAKHILSKPMFFRNLMLPNTLIVPFMINKNLSRYPMIGVLLNMVDWNVNSNDPKALQVVLNLKDFAKSLFTKALNTQPKCFYLNCFDFPKPLAEYTTAEIYYEAVDLYFETYNCFYPLFTKRSFFSRKRSRLLNLIVFTVGLQNFDLSLKSYEFKEAMYQEINWLMRKELYKPNLSLVQSLVISHISFLAIPQLAGLGQLSLISLLNIMHSLGLHLNLRVSDSILRIERYLAYSCSVSHILASSNTYKKNIKSFALSIQTQGFDVNQVNQITQELVTLVYNINKCGGVNYIVSEEERAEWIYCLNIGIGTRLSCNYTLMDCYIKFTLYHLNCSSLHLRNNIFKQRKLIWEVSIYRLHKLHYYKSLNSSEFTLDLYEKGINFTALHFLMSLSDNYELEYHINYPLHLSPIREYNINPRFDINHFNIAHRLVECLTQLIRVYIKFGYDIGIKPYYLYPILKAVNTLKRYQNVYPENRLIEYAINEANFYLSRFKGAVALSQILNFHYAMSTIT